jgi:hypothetical protein
MINWKEILREAVATAIENDEYSEDFSDKNGQYILLSPSAQKYIANLRDKVVLLNNAIDTNIYEFDEDDDGKW